MPHRLVLALMTSPLTHALVAPSLDFRRSPGPAGTWPARRVRVARSGGLTLAAGLALVGVRLAGLPLHEPAFVLLLVVALCALRDGRAGGLASAVAAVVASLLTAIAFSPAYSLTARDTEPLLLMLVAAPAMGVLVGGARQRRSKETIAADAMHERMQERFRAMHHASPDAIILWDIVRSQSGGIADATLAYANPTAHRLMRRADDTVNGGHMDDLFPGARQSNRWHAYEEVVRTGVTQELITRHEELGSWLRMVIVKVGDQLGILGSDVSATKEAEQVLLRSRHDLEQRVEERTRELDAARDLAVRADRAKSDFLSRASHELRTPLNSVIGFANILGRNKSGRLGSDELNYVDRIGHNGRHLLGLVNDLLDLSKIEAGRVTLELSSVSLFDLVHDVRETLEPRAQEMGLSLDAELPAQDGPYADLTVVTDEQRLRQVLINLVGNAVKYTPSGAVRIRVVTNAAHAPVRIEVSDTGEGIAAEHLASIFEPFVAGGSAPRGDSAIGLGLSISRTLCELLEYRLTVTSGAGIGSTFTIHLEPRATDAESSVPHIAPEGQSH